MISDADPPAPTELPPSLTIRAVTDATGLGAHTLRYYERAGLLAPVARAGSGHRRYAAADVAWLEFLTRLRATGMPIRRMREFADLRRAGDATAGARRALLEAHERAVRAEVAALQAHLTVIAAKIAHYRRLESEAGTPAAPRSPHPPPTRIT